jgi:hypothetical protein
LSWRADFFLPPGRPKAKWVVLSARGRIHPGHVWARAPQARTTRHNVTQSMSMKNIRPAGIFVMAWMLPVRHALACVSDSVMRRFQIEQAVVNFVVVTGFVAALMLLVWLIRWVSGLKFSVPGVASVLLGIALGLVGTFVMPEFQEVFEHFGADLPTLTAWAFDFRYFLWAPLLLTAVWWRLSRPGASRNRGHLIGLAAWTMLLFLVVHGMYLPIFKSCVV